MQCHGETATGTHLTLHHHQLINRYSQVLHGSFVQLFDRILNEKIVKDPENQENIWY